MPAKTTEEKIAHRRKVRGMLKLRNKLHRYQKRLVLEGLKITKEKGLDINLIEENELVLSDPSTINVRSSEEYADSRQIIELAGDKFPVLYRKYLDAERRYISGLESLRDRRQN